MREELLYDEPVDVKDMLKGDLQKQYLSLRYIEKLEEEKRSFMNQMEECINDKNDKSNKLEAYVRKYSNVSKIVQCECKKDNGYKMLPITSCCCDICGGTGYVVI